MNAPERRLPVSFPHAVQKKIAALFKLCHLEGFTIMQTFSRSTTVISYGISFGTALAIAISFTTNHSVGWAVVHGFFSWFYVIYYLLFKG